MSKYTTGEAAKLLGVSVRTVQYYDTRGIVSPSDLTEGGRRLYSQQDIKALGIACFLRSTGLPLASIASLMREENSSEVVLLLLKEQAGAIQRELDERKAQLRTLNQLMDASRDFAALSAQTIGDIALTMKTKRKLRGVHLKMALAGIVSDILLVGSALAWWLGGAWQPFAICLPCALAIGVLLTRMYYQNTAYICPQCHDVFRPGLSEFIFSAHTPRTRKLTCTHCGHKGFCVETFHEPEGASR